MTWIKICGITNLEDALMAVDAGANALGFVFYEKSPRNVSLEMAREIVAQVPTNVERIGVLVDMTVNERATVIHSLTLTGVQTVLTRWPPLASAGPTVAVGMRADMTAFFTLPVRQLLEQGRWIDNEMPAGVRERWGIVLDSGTPDQPGGTGKTFDWKQAVPLVQRISENFRVVVAGGLTSANVGEAIQTLKPWGVDVSSGVEASPGKKDPSKVRAFISAVRQQDAKN
jgi:phosphoribosylanthranilate isomerase